MNTTFNLLSVRILIILFTAILAACASAPSQIPVAVDLEEIEALGLRNLKNPEGKFYTSGQPTKEDLDALSEAGVQNVVSVRTEGEIDWDEKAYVESLGMTFYSVPVAGASGVTLENAALLTNLLSSIDGEATVLHCGSGNRVGALIALNELESNGGDVDAAIEKGKDWGLTGLESQIRSKASE